MLNNNGGIYLQKELINIENVGGDYKYRLTFQDKSNPDDPAISTVNAKKLILGMPRRSVEILGNKINYLKKNLTNYVPTEGNPNMQTAIVPKNLN